MRLLNIVFFICSLFFFQVEYFILSIIFGWILAGIAVSGIYHRQLAHNSWTVKNKFSEYISYIIIIISGQGSPLVWSYIHRQHHKYTDTDKDPQSPLIVGKLRTLLSLYKIDKSEPKVIIDLLRNKKIMFIHKNYNKLFVTYFLLLLIINPVLAFSFAGVATLTCSLCVGVFNTIAHRLPEQDGLYSKNFKHDILFWGENNHKLHHLDPRKLKLSDLDFTYYFINLLRKK